MVGAPLTGIIITQSRSCLQCQEVGSQLSPGQFVPVLGNSPRCQSCHKPVIFLLTASVKRRQLLLVSREHGVLLLPHLYLPSATRTFFVKSIIIPPYAVDTDLRCLALSSEMTLGWLMTLLHTGDCLATSHLLTPLWISLAAASRLSVSLSSSAASTRTRFRHQLWILKAAFSFSHS